MLIKYLGPSPAVNVGTFGPHRKGEVKEYPDLVGDELLATCRRQHFEKVEESTGPDDVGAIHELPQPRTKAEKKQK